MKSQLTLWTTAIVLFSLGDEAVAQIIKTKIKHNRFINSPIGAVPIAGVPVHGAQFGTFAMANSFGTPISNVSSFGVVPASISSFDVAPLGFNSVAMMSPSFGGGNVNAQVDLSDLLRLFPNPNNSADLSRLESRINSLETRMDALNQRMQNIENSLSRIEARLSITPDPRPNPPTFTHEEQSPQRLRQVRQLVEIHDNILRRNVESNPIQ